MATLPEHEPTPVDQVIPGHARRALKVKRLALLDQLLALWIVLAMGLGIILGYFVPNTSVVLEKVQFVNVSLPLGESFSLTGQATDRTPFVCTGRASASNFPSRRS